VAVSKDTIRTLAGLESGGAPVVSLYLDVDGSHRVRPSDYRRQLEGLVRQAREAGNGSAGRPAGATEVAEDLDRIQAYVGGGLDRSGIRGLAIFSCSGAGWWEVIALAVPVRDQLVVNQSPQLAQLELLCEQHRRFAVLLADRQRARVLVVQMGEMVRSEECFDALPRHEDDGGDWDRDHVHHHQAAAAQHHLRRASCGRVWPPGWGWLTWLRCWLLWSSGGSPPWWCRPASPHPAGGARPVTTWPAWGDAARSVLATWTRSTTWWKRRSASPCPEAAGW